MFISSVLKKKNAINSIIVLCNSKEFRLAFGTSNITVNQLSPCVDSTIKDYIRNSHTTMDSTLCASLLEHCTENNALLLGMLVHDHAVECYLGHITHVANFLIQMYAKCQALAEVLALFVRLHHRNCFSWNLIIRAFARCKCGKESIGFFNRMLQEGVLPSKITYVSVLDACASEMKLHSAQQMHTRIVSTDFENDVIWGTALVNMYGKCNSLKHASIVFDKMYERNVLSWTSMINACEKNGHVKDASFCFQQMQQEGILPNKHTYVSILTTYADAAVLAPGLRIHACMNAINIVLDVVMGSTLVTMYGKCNCLSRAEMVFKQMPEHNVISWTAMIETYSQHGHGTSAFALFDEMQASGVKPNKATYVGILAACSTIEEGLCVHGLVMAEGFENDMVVEAAIIYTYAKCEHLKEAENMFAFLKKRDVVSWNSMIGAYALYGMMNSSLLLFDHMQKHNMTPNKVTFINLVVACTCHAAALNEGKKIHSCIVEAELDCVTSVSNTLISMYDKSGSLNDAEEVFDKIKDKNVFSWSSMICAYANHANSKKALCLFVQMHDAGIYPDKVTFASVLSACSQAGLLNEANDYLISMMSDYGISPLSNHYSCIVEGLGKAGCLDYAKYLIDSMPFQPECISFSSFLSACRFHTSSEKAEQVAICWHEIDRMNIAPYLLLFYVYKSEGWMGSTEEFMSRLVQKFWPIKTSRL